MRGFSMGRIDVLWERFRSFRISNIKGEKIFFFHRVIWIPSVVSSMSIGTVGSVQQDGAECGGDSHGSEGQHPRQHGRAGAADVQD